MSADTRQNNTIFTQTHQQAQPQPSPTRRSQSDEIPYESVPLPSKGLLYPVGSPLHGVSEVHIKPMTAREEDILMSPALIKNGTAITSLIKSCLIDKTIDPAMMIAGDRNALVFSIRITGYGSQYEASVECGECDAKSDRVFDLLQCAINFLDISPVREFENRFEFTLPRSKKIVHFKFLTGQAEENATKQQMARKKALGAGAQVENTVTENLREAILSVDGIEDRQKIADFVRNMPASDSLALRSYIATHAPDLITKQVSECKHCGAAEEVSIPLGVSFLWPKVK